VNELENISTEDCRFYIIFPCLPRYNRVAYLLRFLSLRGHRNIFKDWFQMVDIQLLNIYLSLMLRYVLRFNLLLLYVRKRFRIYFIVLFSRILL